VECSVHIPQDAQKPCKNNSYMWQAHIHSVQTQQVTKHQYTLHHATLPCAWHYITWHSCYLTSITHQYRQYTIYQIITFNLIQGRCACSTAFADKWWPCLIQSILHNVRFYRTRHKTGHFSDVLPSQSFGLVLIYLFLSVLSQTVQKWSGNTAEENWASSP